MLGGACRSQGRLGPCGETFVNINMHLSSIRCIRGPQATLHLVPSINIVGWVQSWGLSPHTRVLLKSETGSVLVNPRARWPFSSL